MNLARIGNRYITECEPWKVWKTAPVRCETILNVCLQLVANLSIAFGPFLPFSSNRLRSLINTNDLDWEQLGSIDLLPAGHQLNEPELLFEKIDDAQIDAQTARLEAIRAERIAREKAEEAKKVAPQKEECSFEDFEKMDIRTATVLAAERVPKTDKLLKLSIDTGIDKRTIVSGIAEYYSPEAMVGRQICILANLQPRTIRGIESKGMILMAKQGDGSMRFITPEEAVCNGAQIG
jgi:methionyl-tRNA synthetase